MARTGRPSKYKPEFVEQAKKLCLLGATDADLADFFEVSVRTIYRWTSEHEDFCHALKVGKDEADDRVERSLYRKAVGYEIDAVKVFLPAGSREPVYAEYRENVQPDTTAAIFWLKNRRKEQWRDTRTLDGTGDEKDAIHLKGDNAGLEKVARLLAGIAEREETE